MGKIYMEIYIDFLLTPPKKVFSFLQPTAEAYP